MSWLPSLTDNLSNGSLRQGRRLPDTDIHSLEKAALRLLGMREHSRQELRRKLRSRITDAGQLERLLDSLEERGAQSDRRFTREYIRFRSNRGYGPVRIRMELTERGIDASLIEECLDPDEEQWDQVLLAAAKCKFGEQPSQGFREWAKRARFLEYRGFAHAHIRRLLPE